MIKKVEPFLICLIKNCTVLRTLINASALLYNNRRTALRPIVISNRNQCAYVEEKIYLSQFLNACGINVERHKY